ncbi:arylsulfatase [Zobellella endophytica]|uniref:Arylsulfatase n=1 Tax=Zobellella endophytica TaxID=2116700 RepID=A0A2P7R421_9GAMM|nr:arylsulfatase [Zobellella endophytica]PSJ44941.1 arylsulfatase [Zobellella endophytica]
MNWKKASLAALALGAMSFGSMAEEKKPNFLILIADDLGYSDIGSYGAEIATPNLDTLAEEGLRFSNFHTAPTCSPTRSMLMSGVDNHLAGLGNMAELMQDFQRGEPGYEGYLNDNVASIAEVLKDNGYHTYTTGKWHLGRGEERSPAARGFERSYILEQGSASHFDDQFGANSFEAKAIYRENGKEVKLPEGFFSSEFFTDKMLEYMETDRETGRPFLGILSYTAPHWPLHAPDEWLDRYVGRYDEGYEAIRAERLKRMQELGLLPAEIEANTPMAGGLPAWDELTEDQRKMEARAMEIYAAMVDNMDHHIGRLIDYLDQRGELDNTFILFISDNGADGNTPLDLPGNREWIAANFDNSWDNLGKKGSYIDYGAQWAQVGSTPFPYFKGMTSQGGIAVPAIVRYPGAVTQPGKISSEVAHVMDVMPTLLELAGAEHPGNTYKGKKIHPMEGLSFLPALRDEALPKRAIGWELFGRRALRSGDWKLVWMTKPYGAGEWQLYNLAKDPAEKQDLSRQEPEKLAELLKEWEAYVKRNNVLSGEFKIRYAFNTCLYDGCFK